MAFVLFDPEQPHEIAHKIETEVYKRYAPLGAGWIYRITDGYPT